MVSDTGDTVAVPASDFTFLGETATLRDQFAMAVMPALMSAPVPLDTDVSPEWVAEVAYKFADAMLAEREKPQKADTP